MADNLPAIFRAVPTLEVSVPAEALGIQPESEGQSPDPVMLTLPTRLVEPETPMRIRAAVGAIITLDGDEVDADRVERLGLTTLEVADMRGVQARIDWLVQALEGPRVSLPHLQAWLWPKNLACSRPETPVDFHHRATGLAWMLGELPASLFTAETVRLVRCKWFPGDAEILEVLEPILKRWKRELYALRRLKPREAAPVQRRPGYVDPAEALADLQRYEAMPDGPMRRGGAGALLRRLEGRAPELADRYGERLRLMLEVEQDRRGRTPAADSWRDPSDGRELEDRPEMPAAVQHRPAAVQAAPSRAMLPLKQPQMSRHAAAAQAARKAAGIKPVRAEEEVVPSLTAQMEWERELIPILAQTR